MAKKKSGGTSLGLILTLIFFILATFISGTVAYFGYADQQQFKDDKAKAEKEKTTMETKWRQERVRKILLRIALGIEAPNKKENEEDSDNDRFVLVSEMDNFRPQIKEEYDRLLRTLEDKLPDGAKDSFKWKLLTMTKKELDDKLGDAKAVAADPDVAPAKTLPMLIEIYKNEATKAKVAQKGAEDKARLADDRANKAEESKGDEKKVFDAELARIRAENNDLRAKIKDAYDKYVIKHNNDGKDAADKAKKYGDERNERDDQIVKLNDQIKALQQKIDVLDRSSAGGGRSNAVNIDFVNLEERKGLIVSRDDSGFVTLNVGSSKHVKPQITFLVISSEVSWLALLEREESLKRNTPRLDRQPFEDNPYVKAGVEVVEVTGPETSRAKIIFENEPIRNPVQPKDQIFNLAWQPDEEIRVAFCGIVDLDGDGLDNNEDFLRLLERQGVIVDEYLKLKPLDIVKRDGKGMTLRTKYLVMAEKPRLSSLPLDKDTPQARQIQATIAKMSEMEATAQKYGIQLIEARKFLAMLGYKMPKNPAPLAYGAAVYIDAGAIAPPAEPKKE
jgi:hypothetical protein